MTRLSRGAASVLVVAIAVLALALTQAPGRAADPHVGDMTVPAIDRWTDQRSATEAEDETMTTGAGAGLFPEGAELSGVRLSGSTFGTGVLVLASGSAVGAFQTVLSGTSLLGFPQDITLEGKVAGGTRNSDGSVTFNGSAIVDMGDGSVPAAGVPFSVTLTPGTIALVLGTTALPTQTLTGGGVTID